MEIDLVDLEEIPGDYQLDAKPAAAVHYGNGFPSIIDPDIPFIFDIETGPIEYARLVEIFGEFDGVGEFDESTVKIGNLGGNAQKIADKISKARHDHAARQEEKRLEWEAKTIGKAALNAGTGRVLAIGYSQGDKYLIHGGLAVDEETLAADEPCLIEAFWSLYKQARLGSRLIGFNILNFDLPFLCRRSLILGVQVPGDLFKNRRYWNDTFVDVADEWACGQYQTYTSLGSLAQYLGLPMSKSGSGADFAGLWLHDHEAAIEYLTSDLVLTQAVAKRIVPQYFS